MTCTTVFCTVSAEAPAYEADTWMAGGAMVGYCSTGREMIASNPANAIRIATTMAKIGRLIKTLGMTMDLRYFADDAPPAPADSAPPTAGDAPASGAAGAALAGGSTAFTVIPGCTFCRPDTITRSPSSRP